MTAFKPEIDRGVSVEVTISDRWALAHGARRLSGSAVAFDVPGKGGWLLIIDSYYANVTVRLWGPDRQFQLMCNPSCADFRQLCRSLEVGVLEWPIEGADW